MPRILILGAGVTGLAAGAASGRPVFEAETAPGGICSSYYMRPHGASRLRPAPADGDVYRFEIGGGHWIFGGEPTILDRIRERTPVRSYRRRSAVYFAETATFVPYPLQYHLAHIPRNLAARAVEEINEPVSMPATTMAEWLEQRFGPTLTRLFFGPFHERYTAGLWTEIAPQDPYKSPVDAQLARRSLEGGTVERGYNVEFLYPVDGLDALAASWERDCDVRYGMRAVRIDPRRKIVRFDDGSIQEYDVLISTLPLNHMVAMSGLATPSRPDPYTSVLVLNLGATRGPACPDYHWLYVPDSRSGFFRVGLYSAVEPSFLPESGRSDRVALYVERALRGGEKPSTDEMAAYGRAVTDELCEYGFIDEVEVLDPTWIDVAYTWQRPGSTWSEEAVRLMGEHDVRMVGRYGCWRFQGIADSIRDGLAAGREAVV